MADSSFPHELEWTPDNIRRFWDYHSSTAGLEDTYFAGLVGKSLVAYVARRIRIATAVDIGCGQGGLIEVLLRRGHDVYGVDHSPASVEGVQRRFAGEPHFKGAAVVDPFIQLPDGLADTAFMLEVVEHLDDEVLARSLREAHRILKPGGHLVLTTPNEEDLRQSKSMCPHCGNVFHRMQHVRSWSAASLRKEVERFGFSTRSANALVLSPYTGVMGVAYRLAYRAVRRSKPNLIYIGRKV